MKKLARILIEEGLLPKTAAGNVGPYIRFNNKLWVNPYGHEMTPREGSWTRVRLADPRTGMPRKTEMQITWLGPGELSAYKNHRRQVRYKYEDAGWITPQVKPSAVKALIRDYKGKVTPIAKKIVQTARAEGGIDSAIGFASDVLSEVNFHSLARNVGGRNQITTYRASDVAQDLDWDVYAAAALAWLIAGLVKNTQAKDAVASALMDELQQEALENLRRALK